MSARFREIFLLVAVFALIVIAVLDPEKRNVSLMFAVIGVGLYLRRRRRRLDRAAGPDNISPPS
jgi:MYXO-CTERM domain-containing protein